jgi:hypothetical protein
VQKLWRIQTSAVSNINILSKTIPVNSFIENDEHNVALNLRGVPMVNRFVARDNDLFRLEEALMPILGPDIRRKVFVLYGLGGIGKTQLAVEFTRKHQRTFSASFWLDGSTHESIRQSIAGIATQLPERQISEASRNFKGAAGELDMVIFDVLRWFSRPGNDRWLLVIDNVDRSYLATDQDPDAFDVEKYFPDADHGSVLITSRLEELRQLGSSHKLKGMNEDQGKSLVEFRAGKVLEGKKWYGSYSITSTNPVRIGRTCTRIRRIAACACSGWLLY